MKLFSFAALIALIVSSTVSAYSQPLFHSRDMEIVERDPSYGYDHQYSLESRDDYDFEGRDVEPLEERAVEPRDLEPIVPRHASSDLTTRDSFSLEPRIIQMIAKQIVQETLKLAIKAVLSLISDIKDERKNREMFVKNLLAGLVAKNSAFNYMIIHPKHTAKWEGVAGKDWHKEHVECDTIRLLKKTIGYDIYAGKKGVVELQGDGSFINWAFQGRFTRTGNQGHVVTFS
ncbi:hypothetical protein C8J56DRAFT_1174761 [Mycena floridula]|nr:hypothetical protein C8J56DRAFT_1174761 [Mycena floridula]